jgi:hypothetical protein
MLIYFELSLVSLISIILIFKIIKQALIIGKVKQERKKLNTENDEALK